MKTLLNLLPEDKKAAIQKQLRFRFLLWQTFLGFLLLVFYTSILAGIFFILDFQLTSFRGIVGAGESFAEEKSLSEYEKKFRDTNDTVDTIERLNRFHLNFTEVFLFLDTILPPGIAVEDLSTKDYTVLLTGRAATRESLLLLDERLKQAECAEKVNIPISNLFSEENIDFQIDFKLKPECLKKKDS